MFIIHRADKRKAKELDAPIFVASNRGVRPPAMSRKPASITANSSALYARGSQRSSFGCSEAGS
jgi:hypothetical protein